MASSTEKVPPSPSRYASLALMLPVEVKIVESYITWMEELSDHVEKSAFSKADSLEGYIKLVLEDGKSNRNEAKADCEGGAENEEDGDWNDNIGHVAQKMNVAAMYTYLGDFESAKLQLDDMKTQNLEKLKLTVKHRQVIEYFRDSLAWAIGVLKGLQEEMKGGGKYGFLIKGSSKLNVKWEELSEDGDEQIKATLAFLKACLGSAMKVSENITLDLLLEAIQLDPECYLWYHYAYRITRRIRRSVKRSSSHKLPRPSAEEEKLAKTGYDLSPDDVASISNYALVLKETLWMESQRVWNEHEDIYLKSVELLEKALRLANETENKKWSRKVGVYLAEVLAFGKGAKLDQDAGKKMFDDLAIEYPKSTFVLHKVAKLYHHGLARITDDHDGKCIDLERAKDYYKRAINSNPSNYACLMDYLKLLQRLNEYSEMAITIDKALGYSRRDFEVARLYIIKAYLIWVYNPTKLPDPKSTAVELWMFVLKNLPEFTKDIYFSANSICFNRNNPSYVVQKEILTYLDSLNFQDAKKTMLVASFMDGLGKQLNRDRGPRQNWNKERNPRRNVDAVGGDELVDKMKGLSVTSRNNYQRPFKKDFKQLGNINGGDVNAETESKGSKYGSKRSEADEDKAWREKSQKESN